MSKFKIATLLTICFVLINVGIAMADEEEVPGKYEPIQCGDNVYGRLDESGTLTISGTGEMWDFECEAGLPFDFIMEYINKVKIESGITYIGAEVFASECYCISSVEIPNTVTRIGARAFMCNFSLREINIPASVKTIEEKAFYGARLEKCTLNEGLEKIGEGAFYGCLSEKIIIPKSVTVIGAEAFGNRLYEGDEIIGTRYITFNSRDVKIGEGAIGSRCVIKADRGSTADAYAKKYGIKINYYQYKSTLTFKPNGGKVSIASKQITSENLYGKLPSAKRKGYEFLGWYTKPSGGQRIYEDTLVTTSKNSVVYAHWKKISLSKMKKPILSNDEYRKISVSCKSVTRADGYEVRYSLKKDMKSSKTVKASLNTTKEIKKLKAGKKYYVQVRAYKKDSTGNYVRGKWSEKASIKLGAVNKVKYTTKTVDKTKKYNNGKIVAVVTCDKVILKGKSAAIKKINRELEKEYKKYTSTSSLYEVAKQDAKLGREDKYFDVASASVSYNKNGIICIIISTYWYAGGVNNTEWYGLTFDLETGKRLKLSDVCNGTDDEIKARVVAKIVEEGDDMNWDVINAYKVKDMDFYIMPNKEVHVCFAPYEISYGGWGREYLIEGKYK